MFLFGIIFSTVLALQQTDTLTAIVAQVAVTFERNFIDLLDYLNVLFDYIVLMIASSARYYPVLGFVFSGIDGLSSVEWSVLIGDYVDFIYYVAEVCLYEPIVHFIAEV